MWAEDSAVCRQGYYAARAICDADRPPAARRNRAPFCRGQLALFAAPLVLSRPCSFCRGPVRLRPCSFAARLDRGDVRPVAFPPITRWALLPCALLREHRSANGAPRLCSGHRSRRWRVGSWSAAVGRLVAMVGSVSASSCARSRFPRLFSSCPTPKTSAGPIPSALRCRSAQSVRFLRVPFGSSAIRIRGPADVVPSGSAGVFVPRCTARCLCRAGSAAKFSRRDVSRRRGSAVISAARLPPSRGLSAQGSSPTRICPCPACDRRSEPGCGLAVPFRPTSAWRGRRVRSDTASFDFITRDPAWPSHPFDAWRPSGRWRAGAAPRRTARQGSSRLCSK